MPEANASMQDLSQILGDVMSGSSVGVADNMNVDTTANADTLAILEEAHSVIAGQTQTAIPDVPDTLKRQIVERKVRHIRLENQKISIYTYFSILKYNTGS